ncbi:MAG: penicillin-binding protein 2 [Alphaproteobacteria bacterium]|nr:penicillin-binding protein 2 [Alphaproteobacteria bacterium]
MSVWKYEKAHVMIERTIMLMVMFFAVSLVLLGRLFYLQILQGDRFLSLAERNRTAVRFVMPERGHIFDRNGVILADNKKIFQAVLIKEQTPDYKKSIENFAKIIPLEEEEIESILNEAKYKRAFKPIQIKDNLTKEQIYQIHLNAPSLLGIQVEESLIRSYPQKDMVTHLVGYVSLLNEKDSHEKIKDELFDLPGYRIGRTGIEQSQEQLLEGKPGYTKTEINAMGRTVQQLEKVKPEAGQDLYLTIDQRLQEFSTKVFGKESGAAIVVDVRTGEVLAFVSVPTFDANLFLSRISSKKWSALLHNEKNPLQNKALTGLYSPGSIFKLVVALAGLEGKDISASAKVNCSGVTKLGKHLFHCWKKEGHGALTLRQALEHSCDVYFYEMAQKIGHEKILETAKKLGFGALVTNELQGEKIGLIPSEEWKKKRYKEEWRMGDTLNLSIGQGFLTATPLQLVRAVAEIANGGYPVDIHFIKKEVNFERGERMFEPYHLKLVQNGMFDVVNSATGTAYASRFDLNGMKMAGKTATTQVRRISLKEREEGVKKQKDLPWIYRDHALFAAYAPTDKPKYAVIVVVEHGGGGSSAAAPIASKILRHALTLDMENAKLKETGTGK